MVVRRAGLTARAQDTVAVIHHSDAADLAVVTTRLSVRSGAAVSEQSERVWVAPDDDGLYRLNLDVPERDLEKGGRWTVHVLLAPGARHRGDADNEQPPAFDGGRTVLVWTGEQDPLIPVIWNYLP